MIDLKICGLIHSYAKLKMDPKLNNLVDLVLVVGSDNSTGLVKRIVPKRKVQHSDTNGNYTCEGEDSSDDDDLMLELTDPNTFFDPKVSKHVPTAILMYS